MQYLYILILSMIIGLAIDFSVKWHDENRLDKIVEITWQTNSGQRFNQIYVIGSASDIMLNDDRKNPNLTLIEEKVTYMDRIGDRGDF